MSNSFPPLLEVRCGRLGQFPDDCRDLEEVTSDSALVKHPTTFPIQQSLLPPLSNSSVMKPVGAHRWLLPLLPGLA